MFIARHETGEQTAYWSKNLSPQTLVPLIVFSVKTWASLRITSAMAPDHQIRDDLIIEYTQIDHMLHHRTDVRKWQP